MQSSVKPYDPTTDIDIINRVMNIKVYWLETKRVHMFPLRRVRNSLVILFVLIILNMLCFNI